MNWNKKQQQVQVHWGGLIWPSAKCMITVLDIIVVVPELADCFVVCVCVFAYLLTALLPVIL